MIENDEQLEQSLDVLASMYRALAALRRDAGPHGAAQFALFAEGPVEQIRTLEAEIAAYTGRQDAETQQADFWLSLIGDELQWPDAPGSIIENFLGKFRKGVGAIAEYLQSGSLSTRPRKAILNACDFEIVGLQPGSVRIGLQFPLQPSDGSESVSEALPQRAIDTMMAAAQWAASDADDSAWPEGLADPTLRRIAGNELKRILPSGRGKVQALEISGRAVRGKIVRLSSVLRGRLNHLQEAPLREQTERHEGDLREIDLDNLTFKLRNISQTGSEITCRFDADLRDVAIDALDCRVEVFGTRSITGGRGDHWVPLYVFRLETLDDAQDQVSETDHGNAS